MSDRTVCPEPALCREDHSLGSCSCPREWFCAVSPLCTTTSPPTHASKEAPAQRLRQLQAFTATPKPGVIYIPNPIFQHCQFLPYGQAKRQLKGLLVTSPLFNEAWSYGQVTRSAVIICMSRRGRGSSGVHRAPTNVHIDHG